MPETIIKSLKIFDLNEKDISLSSISNHDYLKTKNKINKIDILFKKFEKETNATISQHGKCWEELAKYARDEMEEEIKIVEEEVKSLIGMEKGIERILELAKYAIEDARAALLDRNAPAVERALGRAITALIEAKPNTEVRSSELESLIIRAENIDIRNKDEQINASDLLKNDIDFVDLTESE